MLQSHSQQTNGNSLYFLSRILFIGGIFYSANLSLKKKKNILLVSKSETVA